MDFIKPPSEELARLRPDPLLWEQELDVRPEFAEAVERAVGLRAGRVYWRRKHHYLYALELADLGRGRPSMALVLGFWDRYEPRPPEDEIDVDLLDPCMWLAEVGGLNPADVLKVAQHAGIGTSKAATKAVFRIHCSPKSVMPQNDYSVALRPSTRGGASLEKHPRFASSAGPIDESLDTHLSFQYHDCAYCRGGVLCNETPVSSGLCCSYSAEWLTGRD